MNIMSNNTLAKPFQALRPASNFSQQVIAPPYDVVNIQEARNLAKDKPYSFLRISRAELELPADMDPYSDTVYVRAADNLSEFQTKGILLKDKTPGYYVYKISNEIRSQTGIAVAASIEAYKNNRIKRHELTRTSKERDRVKQIKATGAQSGPVMLVNRHSSQLSQLLREISSEASASNKASLNGWVHEIWPIMDKEKINTFSTIINQMDSLYIADGHHRSAAAEKVFGDLDSKNDGFLAVIFDEHELNILDYNRVVRDLNRLDSSTFLKRLNDRFLIENSSSPILPSDSNTYGLYLDSSWYKMYLNNPPPYQNPIDKLDVSIIQNLVLEPILSIKDSRTDDRIDFVGGSRGPEGIMSRVDSGEMAVGFMMPATSISELLTIADLGEIMPPKSTWFEPKLADGLLTLLI